MVVAAPAVYFAILLAALQPAAPVLRIETAGTRRDLAARLGAPDEDQLRTLVRLTGLTDPGDPIRVVLADEQSEAARTTARWIAGVAHGASGTIVLFPDRAPRYPHDSLEDVLHHEVAHILIHRAADGQPVPRWLNEGLATVVERAWTSEDRRQLAWALAAGKHLPMSEVDAAFQRDYAEAAQAYAISSAFVRELIERHGADMPSRILANLATRLSFGEAFERATGEPLAEAEEAFYARVGTWERWIPLLTSPFVLWTGTTFLALIAIWRVRVRRGERRRRWDAEEPHDGEASLTHGSDGPHG
jgi:hypothetical protein